jgi:hypothetical protein
MRSCAPRCACSGAHRSRTVVLAQAGGFEGLGPFAEGGRSTYRHPVTSRLRDRVQAVVLAYESGLVSPGDAA